MRDRSGAWNSAPLRCKSMGDLHPHSGLIVAIPEAEALVGRHRVALDINARAGVPAHVTVLYPFLPTRDIDTGVLERLGALFGSVPAFEVALTRTAWFGEHVLWLAPADPAPFVALTSLVHGAYPGYPPFAGLYADVVPHLTVGHGERLAEMIEAEGEVREHLPIRSRVREVLLLAQDEPEGDWRTLARFPLAPAVAPAGAVHASRTSVAP